VDDEPKALKNLEKRLAKYHPELEKIGAFNNPVKALEFIKENKPDLVFLDIEMPNLSGFDLLSAVPEPDFEIIFVTAYDQYAIDAFKHAAIGYIVKPIDPDELEQAIQKAKKNIELKVAKKNNKVLLDLLTQKNNTVSIPTSEGYIFVKIENIIRLEGMEGYTKIICCNGQEHISSYNIGRFKEIIGENPLFFQTHRSHIVNLQYVEKYLNEGYVILKDETPVPVSKSYRKELLNTLSGSK
jgi:two-component system LytT family response regulator